MDRAQGPSVDFFTQNLPVTLVSQKQPCLMRGCLGRGARMAAMLDNVIELSASTFTAKLYFGGALPRWALRPLVPESLWNSSRMAATGTSAHGSSLAYRCQTMRLRRCASWSAQGGCARRKDLGTRETSQGGREQAGRISSPRICGDRSAGKRRTSSCAVLRARAAAAEEEERSPDPTRALPTPPPSNPP